MCACADETRFSLRPSRGPGSLRVGWCLWCMDRLLFLVVLSSGLIRVGHVKRVAFTISASKSKSLFAGPCVEAGQLNAQR